MRAFTADVATTGRVPPSKRSRLTLPGERRPLSIGAGSHVVGYAGHNHLMDEPGFPFLAVTRRPHLGYFALACRTAPYLGRPFRSARLHGLLLTRDLMYPGAFTIDGLVRGLAAGEPQHHVWLRGVKKYARFQKRPVGVIRRAFIHDGEARFQRRYCGRGAALQPLGQCPSAVRD